MPTKIICAGLNRSGSTLMYNAVRELVATRYGEAEIYSCIIDDYDPVRTEKYHLLKAHDAASVAAVCADVLLTSFRDIRAVVGSFLRMKWLQNRVDHIDPTLDSYVRNLTYIRKHADLCLRYEDYARDHGYLVSQLAGLIGFGNDLALQASVVAKLSMVKPAKDLPSGDLSTADETTMLHAGHIGAIDNDPAIALLGDEMKSHIDRRYAGWLLEHGYVVPAQAIVARLAELEIFASDDFIAPPLLNVGEEITCDLTAPKGLLKTGFSIEEWGAWSVGEIAVLELRTPGDFVKGKLKFLVGALTPETNAYLFAEVYLNGEAVDNWYWRGSTEHKYFEIPISGGGIQSLTFVIKGAKTPISYGLGEDARRLGMAMNRMTLLPAD